MEINSSRPKIMMMGEGDGTAYKTKSDAPQKHVIKSEGPADYVLSWGNQSFDKAHMVVQCDKPYGIAIAEFDATHVRVGEDLYMKVARVHALQLDAETEVVTLVGGKEESRSLSPAGTWVVRNPGGEVYPVPDGEFQSKYELDA